jgi:hypothetical protein
MTDARDRTRPSDPDEAPASVSKLSEPNRGNCERLAEPFEARTARARRAVREAHRAEISENEAKLEKLLGNTSANVERQFAQVRAGKVSMLDLEPLGNRRNSPGVGSGRDWRIAATRNMPRRRENAMTATTTAASNTSLTTCLRTAGAASGGGE